jgi:molybdenum cofactor biosynthesis protein B
MRDLVAEAGHTVRYYRIVIDDIGSIRDVLLEIADMKVDVLLVNGGTGIGKRDSTYEAIAPLLDKTIPGFGELFRVLSYEEIGSAAMLSRSFAGVFRNLLVFCTPGSPNAVRLALKQLILPEIRHFVWEVVRQSD